jgi:DNA-binding NarL/FixJ family response regulator
MEILPALAQRLSNPEIADALFLSPKTVEHHVASILGKLGLKSRREIPAFIEQHRDRFRFPPPAPR